jgi:molecular chaperone GrpE (heat shock protein)
MVSLKNILLYSRSSGLVQVNTILREQLDQAHLSNQKLTEDLRRLTAELQQVREELTKKTKDWKEEERVSSIFEYLIHNII